ncbi:MAG: hypothetical protein IJ658_01570 [Kiritimatiellae bacterium]|nr:hypothetical protein [Kiritimatiellia bacterium]
MTDEKIQTAIASSAVGLTRHIMARNGVLQDEAYRRLCATEIFRLLSNPDTRLFLEPNENLCEYLDVELVNGVDALYAAIMPDV